MIPGSGIARHMWPHIGAVFSEIPVDGMGAGMRRVSAIMARCVGSMMPAAGESALRGQHYRQRHNERHQALSKHVLIPQAHGLACELPNGGITIQIVTRYGQESMTT